jgi:AcrR family transcriptional regulator
VQATIAAPDRLIDAARRVLGEKGYDAATVREIALAAAVPQGLIHYYFGGKEGLLAAVLMREAFEYREEQARRGSGARSQAEAVHGALERRKRRVGDDPRWHRLRYELFALGLRSPAMAKPLASLLHVGRDAIAALLERVGGPRQRDNTALAAVVLACVDGLALQKLADPTGFDLDAAYAAFEQLLKEGLK